MDIPTNTMEKVRIVVADYYMCKPNAKLKDTCYSKFRCSPVYQVPVIRVFGPLKHGTDACIHIHGIFPYIFVSNWYDELQDKDLYAFAASLDKAINISLGRNASNAQHVYTISNVRGRSFYGYHELEQKFLKITFYNPLMVKRAVDLLQNGSVFNQVFQPYEAHIPYILQFFIDNNLYGMSFLKFSTTSSWYREEYSDDSECSVIKQTYCKVEIDIAEMDICNSLQKCGGTSSNPGLARLWKDEKKRCHALCRMSEITPDLSQIREPTSSFAYSTEVYFKNKLRSKLAAINENAREFRNEASTSEVISGVDTESNAVAELDDKGKSVADLLDDLMKKSQEYCAKSCYIEEDSILGSPPAVEDETDYVDHTMLSQSIIAGGDDFDLTFADSDGIPQLDGANAPSPSSSYVSQSPIRSNWKILTTPKRRKPSKSGYSTLSVCISPSNENLSFDTTYDSDAEEITMEDFQRSPCNAVKSSPTFYPRLSVMKSPRKFRKGSNFTGKEFKSHKRKVEIDSDSDLDIIPLSPQPEMKKIVTGPSIGEEDRISEGDSLQSVSFSEAGGLTPGSKNNSHKMNWDDISCSSDATGDSNGIVSFYNGSPARVVEFESVAGTPSIIATQTAEGMETPQSQREVSLGEESQSDDSTVHSTPLTMHLKRRKPQWISLKIHPSLASIEETDDIACCENAGGNVLQTPPIAPIEKIGSICSSQDSGYEIRGVTLENSQGFPFREAVQDLRGAKTYYQRITTAALEVFVETRGPLLPDPEVDAVVAVFYSISKDDPDEQARNGAILLSQDSSYISPLVGEVFCVDTESELFDALVNVIREENPDILVGYEIEMSSWGYIVDRGRFLGRNLQRELSRVKADPGKKEDFAPLDEDADEYEKELKIVGRIILSIWRLIRHEISLQSYSFENVMFHVAHERVARYSHESLTSWWRNSLLQWIVMDYFSCRAKNCLVLLQQLDFIGKTSELARIFGIQFYEVLSRGSQFRVESMMLRLAKSQNYVPLSPSIKQRAQMRAPEHIPLIMEPESSFYSDPVIVLDFQSLYPSIIIAYNYCFSTCVGRVEHLLGGKPFEFGCVRHEVPLDCIERLQENLNISPCGVAFVDEKIKRGILPVMLEEILKTRLMVKEAMKREKENKILHKVLHARQLGLKLIANVTYGYTAANFSGRMPCTEIGDSVVSKGRETLERAIELIGKTERWANCRVIYGDTDSLFVLVQGNRSKEEAFRIGADIADTVTAENPKPVKLKLEKVYLPCILQTKKRYVGYSYENSHQEKPTYDAKGIETVRRDGCPAVSKMLEKSLRILFEKFDLDLVKQYIERQFTKLTLGRVSIQDLTFAREYRGAKSYMPGACVPALRIAKRALLRDKRSEPRVKERVKYVIVAGPPDVPLIQLVRTPEEFLNDPGLKINTEYYITKVIIPALNRCYSLLNLNIFSLYAKLPRKKQFRLHLNADSPPNKKTTIAQYFAKSNCACCQSITANEICGNCAKDKQLLALSLGSMLNHWERNYNNISKICGSCAGHKNGSDCVSTDCPVLYLRYRSLWDKDQVPFIEALQQKYMDF